MIFLPAAIWSIVMLFAFGGGIALLVFMILTLVAAMNCLDQCRKRHREMEPGMVWLTLIPAFGMVWIYFVIIRTEQALKKEFRSRDLNIPKDFGQPLGIAAAVCYQAGAVFLFCFGIGVFGWIAAVVLFILYWQKLSKHLKTLRRTGRDRDDDYDDDDDRDRRRSRRDDDDDDDDRPRRRSRDEEYYDDEDDRPRRRRRDRGD